uniref:Agglutinin n=1 Tax=Phalera flavescens TaxID=13634 RepID=Q7M3N3_PHAFA|nr:agglutinin 18 kda subunit, PFA {N-terminal} [Phalera flavescens=lobster moths, larval hemolymph, Peptide Partial, 26 aa] [Phalera flavescens]
SEETAALPTADDGGTGPLRAAVMAAI